jgi:phosphoserine phosphatase
LFKGYELGIKKSLFLSIHDYENGLQLNQSNVTLSIFLAKKLTAEQLAAVTKIMSDQQLNIDSIKRLTSRASVVIEEENPRSCVQLSVSGLIE